MNTCIFCGTKDQLTTSMQVNTSRGTQTIWICSEHEDNATPKRVRELVDNKDQMLAEFEKKAKELGFVLTPIDQSGKLVVAESPKSKTPEPIIPDQSKPKQPQKAPKKSSPLPIRTPSTPDAPAYESYTIPDEAPSVIEREEQVVTGRAGAPIAIPKKVVSEAGTTEINIVDTGGDQALQARFKGMSQASASNAGPDFRASYTVHECTFCKGTGVTAIGSKTCPKCKGTGIASRG